MCRANLSLSFDREGVSYLNVLSNDANRHSNLNSKVRFNTEYVLIYIQEKSKLEQLEIQMQRHNCFLGRKKKYCLNLFYKFREFFFILLAKSFQKFEMLLAANYSFIIIIIIFQTSIPICSTVDSSPSNGVLYSWGDFIHAVT